MKNFYKFVGFIENVKFWEKKYKGFWKTLNCFSYVVEKEGFWENNEFDQIWIFVEKLMFFRLKKLEHWIQESEKV